MNTENYDYDFLNLISKALIPFGSFLLLMGIVLLQQRPFVVDSPLSAYFLIGLALLLLLVNYAGVLQTELFVKVSKILFSSLLVLFILEHVLLAKQWHPVFVMSSVFVVGLGVGRYYSSAFGILLFVSLGLLQYEFIQSLYFMGAFAGLLLLLELFFEHHEKLSLQIASLKKRHQEDSRLSTIGKLSASMAHEIRNPLAAVSGSLQLLDQTWKDQDFNSKRLFKNIHKEIRRLDQLVTEFLSYSKAKNFALKKIEMNQIVSNFVDISKNGTQSEFIFQNDLGSDDVYMFGDKDKIKQILFNLVKNADQSMELTPGAISLKVSRTDSDLLIEIRDKGPGLEPDVIKQIFEPFFTTKAKGTGMGLALTQKLVQIHGGTLKATNIKPRGASFLVQFPILN